MQFMLCRGCSSCWHCWHKSLEKTSSKSVGARENIYFCVFYTRVDISQAWCYSRLYMNLKLAVGISCDGQGITSLKTLDALISLSGKAAGQICLLQEVGMVRYHHDVLGLFVPLILCIYLAPISGS